jgi:hypothetical protein
MTTDTATRYPYLISEKYCDHWTVQMALRELIANAIDATSYTDISITWQEQPDSEMGLGCIANSSAIITKRHLLLGESDKKQEDIGQFGEGLKLAALVLARKSRQVWVDSGSCRYTFTVDDNPGFGCRTLFVEVLDLPEFTDGTKVYFTAGKREVGSAKMMFRVFNGVEEIEDNILDASGDVYVKGVRICKMEKSFLGYDLSDKTLINRDRTMVDRDKVDGAIRSMLQQNRSSKIAENVLLSCSKHPDSYEARLGFYPWYNSTWTDAMHKIWGDKVCITTPDHKTADERATRLGYAVVDFGMGMNKTLLYTDEVNRSDRVNPEKVNKEVPGENLTDVESAVLEDAKRITEFLLGRSVNINLHVTEELADDTIMQFQIREIYVNRRYMVKPVAWLAGCILHELAHIESGAVDCSQEMLQKMTSYLQEIAEAMTRN